MPLPADPADTAISRRAWVTLLVTSAGQMLTTFAGSAINVGFPSIQADLGVPRSTLAWAISGYSIAAAAFLLAAGRTADRLGGRRVFLSGVTLFTVGALVATVAPTAQVLTGKCEAATNLSAGPGSPGLVSPASVFRSASRRQPPEKLTGN